MDGGRLWSSPQTRKQVRAAGAGGRSGDLCRLEFIDRRDLRGGRNAETLDMRALSTSSKTRTWNAKPTVKGSVVCHLRETASVQTHLRWLRAGILKDVKW